MSPDRAAAQMAERQYGLISRSQAVMVGFSSAAIGRRLQGGRWDKVLPGVIA